MNEKRVVIMLLSILLQSINHLFMRLRSEIDFNLINRLLYNCLTYNQSDILFIYKRKMIKC